MKIVNIHDYADDESTQTLKVISGVTAEGCAVSEREYAYRVRDHGEIRTGVEITMSTPDPDLEENGYRTLEELTAEADAEELSLAEDE